MADVLPPLTEKEFMGQVVQLAGLRGWKVFHVYDSRRCVPGFPDLVLVKGRRLVAAELKVGKRKPTPAQRDWLAALAAAGVAAYLWTAPQSWDEIERVLNEDSP